MKIITFDDAMRAEADSRLAGCAWCGDDLGIHEWIGILELTGEIVACDRSPRRAAVADHRGADVIAEHIIGFVKRFRREWGPEPTAHLAVGFTRQQQAPKPHYPASDQYAAYVAMGYLRSIGRQP